MNINIIFLVLLTLLIPVLCLGDSDDDMKSMCRHKALYVASIAVEKYEVRFAVGTKNGIPHVEAQALINGVWCFLDIINENGWIYVRPVDNFYKPEGEGFKIREYWSWTTYLCKWVFVNPTHKYDKIRAD